MGIAFTWALPLSAGSEAHRNTVLWGLPAAALLLSLLGVRGSSRPRVRPLGWPVLTLALALAFLLDQGYLGVGWLAHLATFTFGSQALADAKLLLVSAWALPALAVLSIFGLERCLRVGVYGGLAERWPPGLAYAVSAVAGAMMALPVALPGGEVRDLPFAVATLAVALCREGVLTYLFLRGGIVASGVLRALFLWVEGLVINDWYGLFFGSFQFASETSMLYVAHEVSALLALAAMALLLRPGPGKRVAGGAG